MTLTLITATLTGAYSGGFGVGLGGDGGVKAEKVEAVQSSNFPSRMLSKVKGMNLKPCPE